MPDNETSLLKDPTRAPWNKGKLIGAKPPLRPRHVWSIRTRLMLEGRTRDLAMFNLAIDSKLRGCDVVALKVEDVAPNGYTIDRATVRQRKTGRPVKFELTDLTRQAVDDFLRVADNADGVDLLSFRNKRRVVLVLELISPCRNLPLHIAGGERPVDRRGPPRRSLKPSEGQAFRRSSCGREPAWRLPVCA